VSSAALALTLVACGGGGSDPGPVVPAQVPISAANQDDVARASALAVQGSFIGGGVALADDGGAGVLRAPRKSALALPGQGLAPALARVRDALRAALPSATPASGKAFAAAAQTGTVSCSVSGSFTATLNDADNSQTTSVGDSLSVVFTNCSEVPGEVVNGTITAAYTAVQATPTLSVGATLGFGNLSATVQGATASFNGSLALSYAKPTADTEVSILTVAAPLTISANRSSPSTYSDSVTLQAGFSSTSTYTVSLAQTSGTVSGAVSSTRAGGTVTLSTTQPVVQRDVDLYPTSGQIVATGATSRLRTTALNTTNVQVELDANGDGTYEASKTLLWSTLL
jgi:hypothetical protein